MRRSPAGASARARAGGGRLRRTAPRAGSCASTLRGSPDDRRPPARQHRHLVRAPGAFDLQAVHLARAGPALRRPQDEHRPAGPLGRAVLRVPPPGRSGCRRAPRRARRRSARAHAAGDSSSRADEQRPPAVALEQRHELALGNAREHRRVGDLVAVQMEDRQDCAVGRGVEELVRVPARRERPGLGLAVADDAGNEELGIVERCAERMRQRVAELAALVDRARRLRRDVRGDAAGKRELAEERAQAVFVFRDVRVELRVRALEIGVRDQPGAAVTGAGDVDRRQIASLDRAVQVRVDEVEARASSRSGRAGAA